MEAQATDGLMTAAYLKANAKLDPGKLAKMADVCVRENISLSTLAQLKRNDLESLFGLDTLDRARITASPRGDAGGRSPSVDRRRAVGTRRAPTPKRALTATGEFGDEDFCDY